MGKAALSLVALGVALGLAAPVVGEEPPPGDFEYKVAFESAAVPDLDTTLVIEGNEGDTVDFTGNLILGSANIEGDEGPQGWSLGFQHGDGVTLTSTTVEGTAAAVALNGGFVVLQVIDPTDPVNNGRNGIVQAIVLNLIQPVTLPPNTDQIIAKNVYQTVIPQSEIQVRFNYEPGLKGEGKPVANNVTFKGKTRIPTLGDRTMTIREEVEPCVPTEPGKELTCDDGEDNDCDGDIDCDDDDCKSTPACCVATEPDQELTCDDGEDNDCDGLIDCADSDCDAVPPCSGGFALAVTAEGAESEGGMNVLTKCVEPAMILDAVIQVEPVGDIQEKGPQGWSISVHHDKDALDIEDGFPTIQGTDASDLFDGGFDQTASVNPDDNDGKAGFVSSVVLALVKEVYLDPAKTQTITRVQYQVVANSIAANFKTEVEFLDGLKGKGKPVPNILTVKGKTVDPAAKIALQLEHDPDLCGPPPDKSDFIRGDANDDGKVNIADPIWIINDLIREGPETACKSAADANDDGLMDLSDAMYLIQWRFLGGTQPTAPFPSCGPDPNADGLVCPPGSVDRCP